MAIRTPIALFAVVTILAITSDSATAGSTAASQNRQSANSHGTCGQQVTHKHPGLKGADFKAEYAKCASETAAGKNYLTD